MSPGAERPRAGVGHSSPPLHLGLRGRGKGDGPPEDASGTGCMRTGTEAVCIPALERPKTLTRTVDARMMKDRHGGIIESSTLAGVKATMGSHGAKSQGDRGFVRVLRRRSIMEHEGRHCRACRVSSMIAERHGHPSLVFQPSVQPQLYWAHAGPLGISCDGARVSSVTMDRL